MISLFEKPLLIIDPEPEFLGLLQIEAGQIKGQPSRFINTFTNALEAIQDVKLDFQAIYLNHRAFHHQGVALLRLAHELRPATPIFALLEADEPLPHPHHLDLLGIQKAIRKPCSLRRLYTWVSPVGHSIPDRFLIKNEIQKSDYEFIPVSPSHLFTGHPSLHDIYIKLSAQKYLMLLRKGDGIDLSTLSRLQKRGVDVFYITRESQQRYIQSCDALSTHLIQPPSRAHNLQYSKLARFGSSALQFMVHSGIHRESIAMTQRFLGDLEDFVTAHRLDQHPVFGKVLNSGLAVDHGVAVATLVALALPQFQIESKSMRVALGMAALFHDLSLSVFLPQLRDESEWPRLSFSDQKIYFSHPTLSARLLAQVPGIPESVIQGVEQHHERRDGKGFPFEKQPGEIGRIGELLGICDALAESIPSGHSSKNPLGGFRQKVHSRYSPSVLDEVLSLFASK